MEPEELQQGHSPRVQVELHQELSQGDGVTSGFQFEGEDNHFSYYNEANQREVHSSDQEGIAALHPHEDKQSVPTDPQPESNQSHPTQPSFQKVQIPQNLGQKAPIALLNSPKHTKKAPTGSLNSPLPSLSMFKQGTLDLGSLAKKEQPKSRPLPATDRAYKSELANDMFELKQKFMGKDSKKREGKKEANVNKTFAGLPKKPKETTIEFEQMRMLVKMGFEKKKTNYEMLKGWDNKRADTLALHGRIIQLLQNEVDIRIKSSLENFEYYQTFFREKAKQEEKYSSSPVINTRYALQSNSLSKNVYINCSVILNSLCDENTTRCKKINDFVQLIRNDILRELTENHLTASQRELLKVREKISSLKSTLKKHNLDTEERANELASLFGEQSNNITNTTDKDFYRTQLSFLRKALQQIEVQRKLGEYCLEYYHTAIQEQLKRSQVIREAMVTYSKGLKATYYLEPDVDCPEIEQMSKQEEVKLTEQFFSLDEMFDHRTLQLFKARNNIAPEDDIGIDSFTKYINSFNYQPFDSRVLLLKEFNVQYLQGKGKEATEQPCYLVITVDNFLHMFFNASKQSRSKPDMTIKIGSKWIELRPGKGGEMMELIKKEERRGSMMSYFWDNKVEKGYRFKFPKKDNREEFIDYIAKLMVDQF